jgi:hypothetical protein
MPIDTSSTELADIIAARVADCLRDEPLVLPEYLDQTQAATFTSFTPKALERKRQRGEGPRYTKVGKSIRYAVADLRAWMRENRIEPSGGPR